MTNFQKLKAEAWQYYQTWMQEKTYCPALKQDVIVSRKGWDHIYRGSKTKRRNIRDKISRLKLLKEAKYIIRNCITAKATKRNGNSFFVLRKDKTYVVLRQDKQKKIIFHSVYSD